MRYSVLALAALLAVFGGVTVPAQEAFFGREAENSMRGGRKGEPTIPQVMGHIADVAGRSIRSAEVTFFCADCDEVVAVKSNAFGYYTVSNLTEGRTYIVGVHHRKYLFVIGSEQVTIGPKTLKLDFLGEWAR